MSRYIRPRLFAGELPIIPMNLSEAPDRRQYLANLVTRANILIKTGYDRDAISSFLASVPLANEYTETVANDSGLQVRPIRGAEDRIERRLGEYKVTFVDGRLRNPDEMLTLATGEQTRQFASLVSAISTGIEQSALLELANSLGVEIDGEFLDYLVEQNIIERTTAGPALESPRPAARDSVTWLGHASAMIQAQGTVVWIDPHLPPVMDWRPDEVDTVFSSDYADSVLIRSYGPDAQQLGHVDLPRPDAVLITHQDVDHFDLGILMTIPRDTTVFVPDCRPDPWDVDLVEVLTTVLGHERVERLPHNETRQIGALSVTALPFLGEFPAGLPHNWNCYHVECETLAVLAVADAHVSDSSIESVAGRWRSRTGNRIVMARSRFSHSLQHLGWCEEMTQMASNNRIWEWYVPPAGLFAPAQPIGLTPEQLKTLADAEGQVFFYAAGNLPAFRLSGFFDAHLSSQSIQQWNNQRQAAEEAGVQVANLLYGVPWPE